jgi:protein-L-isoaspartate(D-aspartate) O-methyltransferase
MTGADDPRQGLLDHLRETVGFLPARVMAAFEKVDRGRFVPEEFRELAWKDEALAIGLEQTISRPSTVARMLAAVQPSGKDTVLEVGTGTGYQTALLAEMARFVFSIERLHDLGSAAAERLKALGYSNFSINIFDGGYGWPQFAPYDCIVAACASPKPPRALLEQLKEGGRMVMPVGSGRSQRLLFVMRDEKGFLYTHLEKVTFVPFVTDGVK